MAEFCGVHSSDFMAGDRLVFLEEVVSTLSPGREEMRGHCLEETDGKLARAGGNMATAPPRQTLCLCKEVKDICITAWSSGGSREGRRYV